MLVTPGCLVGTLVVLHWENAFVEPSPAVARLLLVMHDYWLDQTVCCVVRQTIRSVVGRMALLLCA
jgi:hypothetical protein